MNAMTPMPKYRSHKEVWALKIAAIEYDDRSSDSSAVITPAEVGYTPFVVDPAYVRKHQPTVGGYFVQYADGYQSFSPAEAFESGYTLIQ